MPGLRAGLLSKMTRLARSQDELQEMEYLYNMPLAPWRRLKRTKLREYEVLQLSCRVKFQNRAQVVGISAGVLLVPPPPRNMSTTFVDCLELARSQTRPCFVVFC